MVKSSHEFVAILSTASRVGLRKPILIITLPLDLGLIIEFRLQSECCVHGRGPKGVPHIAKDVASGNLKKIHNIPVSLAIKSSSMACPTPSPVHYCWSSANSSTNHSRRRLSSSTSLRISASSLADATALLKAAHHTVRFFLFSFFFWLKYHLSF